MQLEFMVQTLFGRDTWTIDNKCASHVTIKLLSGIGWRHRLEEYFINDPGPIVTDEDRPRWGGPLGGSACGGPEFYCGLDRE